MAGQERQPGDSTLMRMFRNAETRLTRLGGRGQEKDPYFEDLVQKDTRSRRLEEFEAEKQAHIDELKAGFWEWAKDKLSTEPVFFGRRSSGKRERGSAERVKLTDEGRIDSDFVQVAIPFRIERDNGRVRTVPACNTPELFEIDQEVFRVKGGLEPIPVLVVRARRAFPMDRVTDEKNKLATGKKDVLAGGGEISISLLEDTFGLANPADSLLYSWNVSVPRPLKFPDGTVVQPQDITAARISDYLVQVTHSKCVARGVGGVHVDIEHMDTAIAMLSEQCAWLQEKWDRLILPATVRQAFTEQAPAVMLAIASQFELDPKQIEKLYGAFAKGAIRSERHLIAALQIVAPDLKPKASSTIASVFTERGIPQDRIPAHMILAHILPEIIFVNVKAWPIIQDLMRKVEAAQVMKRAADLTLQLETLLTEGEVSAQLANEYKGIRPMLKDRVNNLMQGEVRRLIAQSPTSQRIARGQAQSVDDDESEYEG